MKLYEIIGHFMIVIVPTIIFSILYLLYFISSLIFNYTVHSYIEVMQIVWLVCGIAMLVILFINILIKKEKGEN